jgi:AP2 domain
LNSEYKTIELTQGYVAIVDAADYDRVMKFKWCATEDRREDGSIRNVYAQRRFRTPEGNRAIQYLHRFILGVTSNQVQVDHINSDGLDNRQRTNLRVCSPSQNQHNKRKMHGASSRFKGVSFIKWAAKWRAQIRLNYKHKHIGYFTTETDAAIAYDAAARKYFGEFALCNFPLTMDFTGSIPE